MDITIQIDDKEQAILGFMMKDFMQSDEFKRLKRENEKLDKIITLIDEFKAIKTKTHSQVALYTLIWEISDTIDKRGEDDVQCDHDEKLAVDSVVLDEIISVVYGWNRDARGYPDIAMKKIAKIIEERGD